MVIQLSKGKSIYIFHKVPLIEISNSMRQLSMMLKSGLALEGALEILASQSTDGKVKEAFTFALNQIKSGKSMADSMRKYPRVFPPIATSIVDVGERGGTLEENLLFLADYLKKAYELQRKIKGAMVYPTMILAMAVVEVVGIVYLFLPRLGSLYSIIEEPPKFSLYVLNGSAFIRENTPLIPGLIILGLFLFSRFLDTKPGQGFKNWLALNAPVFKRLTRTNILLSFSRTLSILLKSGIAIENALAITQQTIDNRKYAKALAKAQADVQSGQNLAQALAKHPKLFPITFTKMIEIGEQTGSLEENLQYLYEFYSDEVNDITDNLTSLLEPIMLLLIGGIVVLLAVVVIAPIYQITGSIG